MWFLMAGAVAAMGAAMIYEATLLAGVKACVALAAGLFACVVGMYIAVSEIERVVIR